MSDAEIAEALGEDVVDPEMEAIAMFHAIDKDNNGVINLDELHSALWDTGMTEKQIEQLMHSMDSNDNGVIDIDEWLYGYSSFMNGSSFVRSKFIGLRGPTGGYKIEKTERRAIELKQLEKIYTHVRRELKRGSWKVSRLSRDTGQYIHTNLKDPKKVNLYDVTSVQLP